MSITGTTNSLCPSQGHRLHQDHQSAKCPVLLRSLSHSNPMCPYCKAQNRLNILKCASVIRILSLISLDVSFHHLSCNHLFSACVAITSSYQMFSNVHLMSGRAADEALLLVVCNQEPHTLRRTSACQGALVFAESQMYKQQRHTQFGIDPASVCSKQHHSNNQFHEQCRGVINRLWC